VDGAPDGAPVLETVTEYTGMAIFDAADSSIPEPFAWALMIGGFGLTGAARRSAAAARRGPNSTPDMKRPSARRA
jgi:hypothetical protein